MRLASPLAVIALASLTACHGSTTPAAGPSPCAPNYEVYAVRYATLARFPVRSLVAGAPAADSLDIAMMVWVIRGGGRTVLVDAGFYREKFIRQWRPRDYITPSEAVARMGIMPGEVTDVIISHIHWDHADGADLFPRAKVWLQRAEYEYYVTEDGKVKNRGIDAEDATMLFTLKSAGRLGLIEGDAQEVLPGVRAYTGGKHTFASEYVGVKTRSGTVIVASDNAYLYQNLERGRPIAQTLDSVSNLAAQARMGELASKPGLIVPGHDPAVFNRFQIVRPGVVRID